MLEDCPKCGKVALGIACSDTRNCEHPDIVFRLRKRAWIRRTIPSRRSVQEGKPDRIADLLEEAATEIERIRKANEMPRL